MENLPTSSEVKNTTELLQLVTFGLDEEVYGVEVLKVREIIRPPQITKMPNVPNYIDGIINLRGKVIPIVSMRDKFGLVRNEKTSSTRIMVMDIEEELIGFVVDSVSEVIRISGKDVQPSPSIGTGTGHEFITGIYNHYEKLVVLLDLDKMFTAEEKQIILQ